ncbi:hypothetical protein GCM10019059_05130 [Camelimonas fluminis]|nr:hypothetical protein GCM10019059_05130 [Camelimonas fluminis]
MPGADMGNSGHMYGYVVSQAMHKVLEAAGDNLTRENIMKQASNMKDVHIKGFLPGITVNTAPGDHAPVKQMQMVRFKGEGWERFGGVLGAASKPAH